MSEPYRPDPDDLLQAIKKREAVSNSGRLRIFFGMSAGVGKTFAMLKAGQERLREGVDIVVGLVETHGRAETEALLSGLPIIPKKDLSYRDIVLKEMDIDAVLARKPQLVLVDELAHTNAPGARHPKRWQDVIELLDAGIDVYTTLNVQHVESRKEYVEQVTGITIRETVPDTLLQRASQIILVDITPSELLQRLKDGKVYLGERADAAARNFFKEDRLTALREIALRLTAEAVDNELQGLTAAHETTGSWRTSERLMVAVSHSPHSEDLVRATRRLAFSLDAPWIAVNVDTGITLKQKDSQRLAQNLSLVRELGGEVVTLTDVDISEALIQVAQQRGITQLVIGHPEKRWLSDLFSGGSLLDRLAQKATTFDIHVLKPARSERKAPRASLLMTPEASPIRYWFMLWIVLAAALVSAVLLPIVGYRAVGFVFLLGVLVVGLFVSIGPTLFAAVLAALTWDYFFIPPRGNFHIGEPEDVAMCVALLLSASVTGTLMSRIRRRERLLRSREERTAVLYQIASALSAATDRHALAAAVSGNLSTLLNADISVALADANGRLEHIDTGLADYWMIGEKEWIVASWAFEHRKAAGWSTDTLASAAARYVPLNGPTETTGVLAFKPRGARTLSQDEENLLMAVARQMAVAAERELLQERSSRIQQLAESERLYQTILSSVSHELRTPLTAIIGNASALSNSQIAADPSNRQQLADDIVENAERLNRVVSNLLDMSRLNSGKLSLKRDWHDLRDLITVTLSAQKSMLAKHHLSVNLAESLPLVRIDFQLFQQALTNLVLNAAGYTPEGTTIEVGARIFERTFVVNVSDNGPGLPEDSIPHLFEMFYRVPGSRAGGAGIGLAITQGIIEAHGGTITARNLPTGGACFTISLPLERQPEMPQNRGEL
ncbi:MAG: sensor histidine kinase KdpD [Candidatus Zixiibacteriota bacterium]